MKGCHQRGESRSAWLCHHELPLRRCLRPWRCCHRGASPGRAAGSSVETVHRAEAVLTAGRRRACLLESHSWRQWPAQPGRRLNEALGYLDQATGIRPSNRKPANGHKEGRGPAQTRKNQPSKAARYNNATDKSIDAVHDCRQKTH